MRECTVSARGRLERMTKITTFIRGVLHKEATS